VLVFNQDHLRRSLKSYLEYHPGSWTHLGLDKDTPLEDRSNHSNWGTREGKTDGRRTAQPVLQGSSLTENPRLPATGKEDRSTQKLQNSTENPD